MKLSGPEVKCKRPSTLSVYTGAIKSSLLTPQQFDNGFPVLLYKEGKGPRVEVRDKGNNQIVCEEIWEQSLQVLDKLGAKAKWREDVSEVEGQAPNAEEEKNAILKYQAFRRLIEKTTRHPIPWVLEVPYTLDQSERDEQLPEARMLKERIFDVIEEIKKVAAPSKLRQQMIVGLFWFAAHASESEIPLSPQAKFSLRENGLEAWIPFLEKEGGLGLFSRSGRPARATEQAKTLYAIYRMAGLDVFFVDVRLTPEYVVIKDLEAPPPLPPHVALGVHDGEKVKIVDMALGMVDADYVDPLPSLWQAHPWWELSLRHFWMGHLSNRGLDQQRNGDLKAAKFDYDTGFMLGKDSTAYLLFGNMATWFEASKSPKSHPATTRGTALDIVLRAQQEQEDTGGVRWGTIYAKPVYFGRCEKIQYECATALEKGASRLKSEAMCPTESNLEKLAENKCRIITKSALKDLYESLHQER